MNSFVTSGGVLYCSYEGERTILRGKAPLFAGEKFFNVACYVTYGRMACGTLSISEDGKVEFVLGEIYVLYGGANVLF